MNEQLLEKYGNIPAEKFEFASTGNLHDQKFDTKPVGYFQDAFRRFCKNKSSVVAAIIILLMLLFAIFVPIFSPYKVETRDMYYAQALPKWKLFAWAGWDGTNKETANKIQYDYWVAMGVESGRKVVTDTIGSTTNADGQVYYTCKVDTYTKVGYKYVYLENAEELDKLIQYQIDNGVQVMYPLINESKQPGLYSGDASFWYLADSKGNAILDEGGKLQNIYSTSANNKYQGPRIDGDDGSWVYYRQGRNTVQIRVCYYDYYTYINGHEPSFIFGVNSFGQDILTCLASGARFSFLFAIAISAINLTIGAIYGAIEGYFGGAVDMVMERVSDILSGVPFIVVATLFQMHLQKQVGVVPSLLFAFVLTGWIGMASTVRMQFYRYKNQEYVLAARTLGSSDWRIMWKHVFPNSLGTIVTSSVLVIPSVIFSESTLTYLGIVNLQTTGLTSVGTLLAGGEGSLSTYPHIILFPALFIALLMISFNLFGNGLRDAFNPSLRGSED